ncbi:hypothetical protein GGR58DRAFT_527296 [Xylaria digitata]|nr:hypothetical protein GGR58DRAFT_527296 [Xylaria digitata]
MPSKESLIYVQRFPALGLPDRTNKFAVSFDNLQYIGHTIDHLKQLLASKFYLISDKPDSFLIWKQTSGRQSSLLFLLVDMEQAGVGVMDMMEASNVIEGEGGLVLRNNNRDYWMTIQLPCGCEQERAPFPSLRRLPGSPEYEPVPGVWHDPNKCQGRRPFTAASLPSGTTAPSTFGYPLVAQPTFTPFTGGAPMAGNSMVASPASFGLISTGTSMTYSHETAATASPTGEIVYLNQFAHPTSTGAMYTPTGYTPLSGDYVTGVAYPDLLPANTGTSMTGVAGEDYTYPHMVGER